MATKPAPTPRTRRTYSQETKAEAVALLHANGYPDAPNALAHTASVTGVGHVNLIHWDHTQGRTVDPALLQDKKLELSDKLRSLADAYLDQAAATVSKTSGVQAMTAAAIAIDKMRLLQGLPTAIVGLMPDALGAIRALGYDPAVFFAKLVERAEQEAGYKRLPHG